MNVCFVHAECTATALGTEYMGTTATSAGGYTCRPWTEATTSFVGVTVDANYPDGSVAAASNYCRNPDSDPNGLWCFTTDLTKNWDYCSVPLCSGKCISAYNVCHMYYAETSTRLL